MQLHKLRFFVLLTIVFFNTNIISAQSKVSIANGNRSLEFSPYSTLTNSYLIEPIDLSTLKGLSTSFYLRDTASWRFYTQDSIRLSILGNGKIITHSPLLVNNAALDNRFSLNVKGSSKFDSSVYFRSEYDTTTFISINTNTKSQRFDPEDGFSAYTVTPTAWRAGKKLPVFRLRHPLNTSGVTSSNTSVKRDFMILPYEYGMAIEYNGVVECWVGEWSIHRGTNYYDLEGNNNGWGGVLWVGDDQDMGGVRSTARNNSHIGGTLNYGEISVEKFAGGSHGDLQFRLPSQANNFDFVYGRRGTTYPSSRIKVDGWVLPRVSSTVSVTNPERAQMAFDSLDSKLKYYTGSKWVTVNGILKGKNIQSSNGSATQYKISHGLNAVPEYFNVIATSAVAANISYVTADNEFIYINYITPPSAGINNLSWNWMVE
jgi:hypothetical protein